MIDYLWSVVANFCCRDRVRSALIRWAQRHPYFHLGEYMHRWWCLPSWALTKTDEGYLFPKQWMPFAIRIHHIKRPDADPYLHDHPWDWRTIVLKGYYCEEDVFGYITTRVEGDTRAATAETLHRIVEVSDGGVWTLFITRRRRNKWGFMVGDPARKVYHRDYESPNNRIHAVSELGRLI